MPHNTESLYERIVTDIRRKIEAGELVPGSKILSISELGRSYHVSSMTVVRAVHSLKELGLINAVRRKGLYVAHGVAKRAELPAQKRVTRIVVFGPRDLRHQERNLFYASIMDSIYSRADGLGLDFKLEHYGVERIDSIMTPPLRLQPGDGVIVVTGKPKLRLLAQLEEQQVPYVLVDSFVAGCRCVVTHNVAGMRQAVEHLFALGHRRLSLIKERYSMRNPLNEAERVMGFLEAAAWRGVEARCEHADDPRRIMALLKSRQRPTALLFTHDALALTFLRRIEQSGYRAPRNVSMVGFDDYAGGLEGLERLTTLRVDRPALGRAALDLLLDSINPGADPAACRRIAPELIVRSSSAQAPGSTLDN